MASNKKPRKKYHSKGVRADMLWMFAGMGTAHSDNLKRNQVMTHMAMADMAKGEGTREQWNRVVGAINLANIICEQGIGDEYRYETTAAIDALLAVGIRAAKNGDRFVFTGDELKAVNAALSVHDAQLENMRGIDVNRASDELIRREKHRINSTTVMDELAKESARMASATA